MANDFTPGHCSAQSAPPAHLAFAPRPCRASAPITMMEAPKPLTCAHRRDAIRLTPCTPVVGQPVRGLSTWCCRRLCAKVRLIVARRGATTALPAAIQHPRLRRRARIAQTKRQARPCICPCTSIAAAIHHGVVDAMLLQHAHARFQDGQLGNPTQIQRWHAAAPAKRGASVGVQQLFQHPPGSIAALTSLLPGHLLHTSPKCQVFNPPTVTSNVHRSLHGCAVPSCSTAITAGGTATGACPPSSSPGLTGFGVVFAQQRLQLNACVQRRARVALRSCWASAPLNHDVHGRPHHRPLCTHGWMPLAVAAHSALSKQRYG